MALNYTRSPSRDLTVTATTAAEIEAVIEAVAKVYPRGLDSMAHIGDPLTAIGRPNGRDFGTIKPILDRAARGLDPAATSSSGSRWIARILIADSGTAPATYGDAALNGYGRTFECSLATHEANGCGRPDLIGRLVRYAYYR